MKKSILLLLCFSFVYPCFSQVEIGFKERASSQYFSSGESISIEFSSTDKSKIKGKDKILIKLSCSKKGNDVVLGEDIYQLSKDDLIVDFMIPQGINNDDILIFKLDSLNTSVKINKLKVEHIVFLKKRSDMGFKHSSMNISIDEDGEEELIIPIELYSSNYAPIESDNIKFTIDIPELNMLDGLINYKKDYTVNFQKESSLKLILKPSSNGIQTGSETNEKKKKENDKKKNEDKKGIKKSIENFKIEIKKIIKKGSFTVNLKHDDKTEKISLAKDKKTITIVVKKENKYSYEKVLRRKYNFHIGTNFDFQNELEVNSFYSEINFFLPNLFLKDKMGLQGGIYKNSSISDLKERDENVIIKEIQGDIAPSDTSVTITTSRAVRTPRESYENLGIYAGFLYRILKNTNIYDDHKFEMFLLLNFEVIERRVTTTYVDELLFPLSTEEIPLSSFSEDEELQSLLIPENTTVKYYSSYYGLGLPMRYNNDYVEILMTPSIGIGAPGYTIGDNSPSDISSFAAVQFSLIEKNYGIKLSGDLRKYLRSSQTPFITINLSKSFDITNLIEANR